MVVGGCWVLRRTDDGGPLTGGDLIALSIVPTAIGCQVKLELPYIAACCRL
jgi:hypothetical protein